MAPIKFEDSLKEKLEERRLQPSDNSWESLSNRLEANSAKSNNKRFWWFGIAASFVGVLIITTVFFTKDIEKNREPAIVDTNEPVIYESDGKDNKLNQVVKEDIAGESQVSEPKTETIKKEAVLQKQLKKKQEQLVKEKKSEAVAQTVTKKDEISQDNKGDVTKVLTFKDIKVQEVVAQINELKKFNKTVSDAEIDSLLDRAQKEITLQKLYNESTKRVDAEALLQGVEADLDQSFRERVFEALRSGYESVKTAVAERNN